MEQRTLEWYRARLGHITSSMVGLLMGAPTKKAQSTGEVFSETAKGYLYQLAAERNLSDLFRNDDTKFSEWLDRTNVESHAMRYGADTEDLARLAYSLVMPSDERLEEAGFVPHFNPELQYGDSPDGLVFPVGSNVPSGVIEIKCPNPATWMKYYDLFRQGKSLKEIEDKYYWQCQSHMLVNDVSWCDFIFYDKMQNNPLRVIRIDRCNDDCDIIIERVKQANDFINNIINSFPDAQES